MKRLLLKTIALILITIPFTNCEKESLDSPITDFVEQTTSSGIKTVPLEQTLAFLNTHQKKNKSSKNGNSINLNIDLESLRQVDITKTNAKLNIANATTKFDNVETQVLQIEIDGELQTVLLHHIINPQNKNPQTVDKNSNSYLTESVYSTNLSGVVISGFSLNNGSIFGTYNFSNSILPDPCWGIACGITLDEVVISSNTPSASNWAYNYYGNTSNVMMNYQFVRSANNYSSMGIAYASYYRSLEVEKWKKVIIEDSGPKIDPMKETKCFDRTSGGKLTVYVQQPKENSLDLIGPHEVGHVFVGIEQNGKIRVFGFYPPKSASRTQIALGKNYVSELRDNSRELYHVSISTNINATQMNNIINYVQNHPPTYNLNTYACVDFGITIGNLGGLNLPSTTVSDDWGLFNGRSPAKLGQEIRDMNSTSTKSIKKTKGNAPSKTNEQC